MAALATETFKLLAAMWLFVRAFAKAIIYFINENKAPKQHQLKGTGIANNARIPEDLPSIIEIKRALPLHCFKSSVSTSMYFAIKDVVILAVTYYIFSYLHSLVPVTYWLTMPLYWAIQGTVMMGVFVVGHDCGHESFSKYNLLNDVMGQLLHGILFCPYYMWKLSHRHHHKHTGDFQKDEVFYPVKLDPKTLPHNRVMPGFALGVGWFMYLLQGYKPRRVRHFTPFEPMYIGHFFGCSCSLATLSAMAYFCMLFCKSQGLLALINYYVIPVLVFGSYLVIITFLHHTEMNIPWYASEKWDFVRGQLSTIDRHYGIVHEVIHNIGTHQMHHMFSKIPHYHLEEATRHFRASFPDLVRACDEPILSSFSRMFNKYQKQAFVDDDTKVHFYN